MSNSRPATHADRIPGTARSEATASLDLAKQRARKSRRRPRKAVLGIEFLEFRQLMAQVVWDGDAGSLNWADTTNWSGDVLPTAADDVVIPDLAGDVTIESRGAVDIRSLISQESLSVAAGTFTLSGPNKSSAIAGALSISNSTLTVNGALQAHDLSLYSATLTGAGDVTVIGELGWYESTMSGPGTTTSLGTLTIDGNYKNLIGRTLLNQGVANLGGYRFSTYDGALIRNVAGATWNFTSDTDFRQESGDASLFVNDGTITKSAGTGWATFNIPVQNNADVIVSSGGLQFNAGGTASATAKYNVTPDATAGLGLYGGLSLAVGSSVSQSGPGRVYLADADIHGTYSATATQTQGGTTTFHDDANILALGSDLVLNSGNLILESMAGTQSVLNLNLYRGTLTLPAGADWTIPTASLNYSEITGHQWNLTVTDTLGWYESTMSGPGTTASLGTLTIDGNYKNLIGRTLLNQGVANLGGYRFSTYDGALIHNVAGATWNFTGDTDFRQESGDASLFVNDGNLTKSAGTGWAYLNVPFENHGTIVVVSGGIGFNSVSAGLRFDVGAGMIVESDSAVRVNGSLLGSTNDPQAFVADGTTILAGGSPISPNQLEVMGHDLGPHYTGFYENFSFGTLQLENAYVQLVDQSDNLAGTGKEAIYVDTLIVPAESTLDLSGYQIYARVTQINGTIVGGAVTLLPTVGSFATTTGVQSSHASATYGESLTFTATVSAVSSAAGTPIGSVQFVVDGANFGQPLNLVNGTATSGSLSTLGSGTHTVSAVYNGKYLFGTSTAANLSQSVAKAGLVIKANDAAKVAGDANPSFSGTYTGFVNGDGPGSLTNPPVFSTTATIASQAGQYPITAAGAVSINYAISYLSGTLNVTPNTVATTTSIQSSVANSTYGDALTFTAIVASSSAMPTGSVRFLIDGVSFGSTVALVNGSATSLAISSLGAGAHSVGAVYLGESNFEVSTSSPLPLTVAKKSLVIAVVDTTKAYGLANPPFAATYTGFVNGNSATSLTTPPTFATAATAASGVGIYTVIASGATASNYAITYQPGTLTVNKAGLTIKVNDATKVYGQGNPSFSATYVGLINGDLSSSLASPPAFSTIATAASPVGAYAITAAGAFSNNYTITYKSGSLNVTKAALTVTADNQSILAGSAIPPLTYAITGFVDSDTVEVVTGIPALSTGATPLSQSGTYTITVGLGSLSTSNYNFTSLVAGTLTLRPRSTADNMLTLNFDHLSVSEGGTVTATITRNWVTSEPLTVNLTYSSLYPQNPQLNLALSVTIPAGQASAAFTFSAVNDEVPEKDESIFLSATAADFAGTSTSLIVTDDDVPVLSIEPSTTSIYENGGGITFVVRRQTVTGQPLTVRLSTSDDAIAGATATVIIPAGQATATFTLTPVDNAIVDGNRPLTVYAKGAFPLCGCTMQTGWGTAAVVVIDDDAPALSLSADQTSALEGIVGAFHLTITRNTSAASDLFVNLSSADPTMLIAPGTVTIPAGQVSVTVALSTGTDGVSRPPLAVLLTVSTPGLDSASKTFTVIDRDTADLRASHVGVASSGLIGQTTTVTWDVSNTGSISADAPWREQVYLSSDAVLDAGDTLAADLNVQANLAAGASSSRSATITFPEVPGTYYVIVVADATNVIAEPNESDNIAISTSHVAVLPTYNATVTADADVALVGTPIHLSGLATLQVTNAPAANVAVTVRVVAENGVRRVISATTDSSGHFTATFTPLSNEAGTYRVAAAHPSVVDDVVQAQFKILGMRSDASAGLSLRLVPGNVYSGTIALGKLGSVPLTGLTVSVVNVPSNVTLFASVSSMTLTGNGSVELAYSGRANDTSIQQGTAQIRVNSAEGATLDIAVAIQVVPATPQVEVPAGGLNEGVVRGEQKVITVEIANTGGAPTGLLQVQIPTDIPWLTVASGTTIPSLAPGQTALVTFVVTPPANVPLGIYEGSIHLTGEDVAATVPYSLRTLSAALGNLNVTVEDEYTYFAAGNPLVAGATVVLRDPFDNTVIVAQGATTASGTLHLANLREGTYLLEIQAPKHGTARGSFTVKAGIDNETKAFLPRQMVNYSWNVKAADLADSYTVELQSTFETGVPAPVVTLTTPKYLPDLAPGETAQVEFVVTNHGLIAAQELELLLPDDPTYELIPLVTDLGTLPGLSELRIPVLIRLKPTSSVSASGDGVSASAPPFPPILPTPPTPPTACSTLGVAIRSLYFCGVEPQERFAFAAMMAPIYFATCILEAVDYAPLLGLGAGGGNGSGSGTGTGAGGGYRGVSGIGGGLYLCDPVLPPDLDDLAAAAVDHDGTASATSEGVCAQVKIEVDQTAVVARSVFQGGLELTNTSATQSLDQIKLVLEFRDKDGNIANDKFTILGPDLSALSAVDGTGVVLPSSTGTARYTFIPNRDAAPVEATSYLINGLLSYFDPETGQTITVPIIGATITVLPDPLLKLDYFLEKDVLSDDPFTTEVEPAVPFTLGLLVTNSGHGAATDFSVTSSQPKIIENKKGLLTDFQIVASQVGGQVATPSLTVDLGNIAPGQTQIATWSLTSSLLGHFIDYSASYEHADALGGERTSIIDSVTLHELIHSVLDTRPGADVLTDFLVNDDLDTDALPDALYFSDGTTAAVSIATSVVADHLVTLANRTVHLTATMDGGWSFLRLPDPGAGYELASVVRSDGKVLLNGTNVWQTAKDYDKVNSRFVSDPRLNLLDDNGTGDYTLTYVLADKIAPVVTSVDSVSPDPRNAPIDSVTVQLSEAIDLTTFDWHDVALTRNGAAVALSPAVEVALKGGTNSTYVISGLASFTTADGAYQLKVDGSGIQDYGANAGLGVKSVTWSNGNAPAYIKVFGPVTPDHRATSLDTIDVTFSKAIDAASFDRGDLKLTRDGADVAIPGSVAIADLGGESYRISGLAELDATQGTYVLTVNATDVVDDLGAAGLGTASISWVVDTTPPVVTAVQTLATNPRNIVVQALDVTFSEPIDVATFDRSDIVLTRNGSAVTMDDRVTVEAVSESVHRIKGINWFVGQEGSYVLTVAGTGVTDLAGNAGVAIASTSWLMDTTRPVAPAGLAITPDRGISSTDGLTNTGAINFSGALAESGLSVRLFDFTADTDLGYANVVGSAFSAAINLGDGVHKIRAVAIDAAGNFSADAFFTVLIDSVHPTVVSFIPVDTPRTTLLSTEDITLSEPIDLATFDWHDLWLTVNSGPNLIDAAAGISVAVISGSTYRISGLEGLTRTNGSYKLTVNSAGIQDRAGNAGLGMNSVTWNSAFDNTAPPTSSATSPAMVHDLAFTVSWSGVPAPGMTIVSYDIYSQVDGGTFSLWLAQANITSAIFTGSAQHQYGFFSIATDLAGHQEAMKTVADASTFVSILGEIHGRVFEDVNGSGTDTASPQSGLAGWTVFLDHNGNGTLDPNETSTLSAADGTFAFTGLQPGVYVVTEIVKAGWEMTYPSAGDSAIQTATVTVTTDSPVYLSDFDLTAGTGSSTTSTSSSALNQALIGLDQFRNDVRFTGIDGSGSTVVVLDTGVDVNNLFFGSIGSDGLASGIAYQYNFVTDTNQAGDVMGHGTAVASLIASRDAAYPGIAPGVRIIDLKVLDDAGKGKFGTVGRALDWVINNAGLYNIVSVNMSFGDGGEYTSSQSLYALGSQLDALARSDVIVVSAAGNAFYSGGSAPGVAYPAADPSVIAVGAVWGGDFGGPFYWSNGALDRSTGPDQIISFSQRDAGIGEIFAPGGLIQGARPGGGIATFSGTSLASPAVAATAALAQELAVDTIGRRLTLDEFRYFIESSATIIHDGDNEDDNVVNTGLDYRRLNVMALAEAILAYDGLGVPDLRSSRGSAGTIGIYAPIAAAGTATITLGAGDVANAIDFGNHHLPPSATVVLGSNSPRTNDVLTTKVTTSDPAGDPVGVSFVWKRNGQVIAGASGSTLDLSVAGQGDKGDVITVEVIPSNGHVLGAPALAQATVVNSAPAVSVQLEPISPETNDVMTAITSVSDPDGDVAMLHYLWKQNGLAIAGESSDTLDLSLAGHGDLGDVITVEVTPGDGEMDGATVAAAATVVDVTPPAPPTALAITPDHGASGSDGLTNTSAVSLVGRVAEDNLTVFFFDVTTSSDLGSVRPVRNGTAIAFARDMTLAAGNHHLRVRTVDASGNTSADAFLDVTIDQTGPTSSVNSLPAIATSYDLTVSAGGADPGTTSSGIAKYDLYVAIDGGQFGTSPWATVTPANPSAVYHAAPGHHFYFRSIATDIAGNVEIKSVTSEAGTTVPDLTAPVTAVATATPNDSLTQFTVNVSGIDLDGSVMASFQVYVQVDGGAVKRFATVPAGSPDGTTGRYAATVKYQASDDGVSHNYRFFSKGTDSASNVEADHASPNDIIVTHAFQPRPIQITRLLVQDGAVGRSFIQSVDVFFNKTDETGTTPIGDLIAENRVALIRHPLSGVISAADPSVPLTALLSAVDHALHFDFGQYGLGGVARANMSLNNYWNALAAGDGYYEVDVDLNHDGAIAAGEQVFFYRLLGDVDGDKIVDSTDSNKITSALGAIGVNPFDANGDGGVDATDRSLAVKSNGRALKSTLRLDD